MCGILTLISSTPASEQSRHAAAMLATLAHRGPDDRQLVSFSSDLEPISADSPVLVTFAFQRLAILDLSPAGRQPMRDPSGRWWLILNGEIYNYVELRQDLERRGERFQSGSDTEVLLRLLACEGITCLPRLDGMFAFVALDARERQLFAVRDRFGIKPLYWWMPPGPAPEGDCVFASEIKAFTAHPGWQARLDRQRGWDYLTRGLIDHTQRTLFEGVESVPAGHLAQINLDGRGVRPVLTRWYELRAAASIGSPREWPSRCLELLSTSVTRQLRADVTVGSCLSGGLDSSSIVCLAAEALKAQGAAGGQKTFTARSPLAEQDEWRHAVQAAEMAHAQASPVHVDGGEAVGRLDEWVWIHDEPPSSPSMVLQHAVFRSAAASGVKVMLDGQGADEQLGGYHSFFKVRLVELAREGRFVEAARVAGEVHAVHGLGMLEMLRQATAAAAPASWLRAARHRRGDHPFIDYRRLGAEPVDPFDEMTGRRRGVREFSVELLSAGSLPMLLHWEDRNSMAHSIEARVPFLNHEMVEFALALPSDAKIQGGMTKLMLREAMRGRIPESIRTRTDKIAFAAPDERWLCVDHREETIAALRVAEDVVREFLRPDALAALHEIARARRPYDGVLWRVLCFAAWMRRFSVAM